MIYLISALSILTVLIMSIAIGGQGTWKNLLSNISFVMLVATTLISFFEKGILVAVILAVVIWFAGTIGGMILNKKYGGLDAIEAANAGSYRSNKKMLENIRKGK